MCATTVTEFTALGVAQSLVDSFISTYGWPDKLLPENGPHVRTGLSRNLYHFGGVKKLATSLFHAVCNGGAERIDHDMSQMLPCEVNERQND